MRRRSLAATTAALLFLSAGSTAMANVRASADIGLLELSPGMATFHSNGQLRMYGSWLLKAQVARVELGAEVTDHIGITAGAALVEGLGTSQFSFLPVSARVYWDFTPNQLWRRSTAYVTAVYHHDNHQFDEPAPPRFVSLGVGATYTYYAVTARAELFAPVVRSRGVGLLLGAQVGGSYILGRH